MSVLSVPRLLDAAVTRLDRIQRSRRLVGFIFAVAKKYNEDEGGHKAALIAYYGFLSLFPLLLVLSSVIALLAHGGHQVGDQLVRGAVDYFPVIGRDLQQNIHGLGKTGMALVVGLLLTLFGARGVADAIRTSLDHIWQVPYAQRSSLPGSLLRSMGIITLGGLGLALSPVVSGYALVFGHGVFFWLLSLLLASLVLFATLTLVVRLGLSVRRPFADVCVGILVATLLLEILQSLGGYLVARELQRLDNLYGTFAIVLGLMYWIYLQAQVLLYALELDTVRIYRLWPRSMHKPLTPADRRAYHLYVTRAQVHTADD